MGNSVFERTNNEYSDRPSAYIMMLTETVHILELLREREKGEDLTRTLECLLRGQESKKRYGFSQAELREAHDRIKRELREPDGLNLSSAIFEAHAMSRAERA